MSGNNDLDLDASSRKELESFIETQQAQTRVQTQVNTLAEMCWDKCVGSISSGFSRGERSCLENCVDRFLDTSLYLVKRIEDERAAAAGHH
ncbi:Tim10/DDP family zinc finger-domain-containing protein [Lenzites betulinus]|nr:Tim10/DDP family zinc finger-domain-containing protein [Lenzites betulinus]